jgi:acetyl-CoA C-acetyltransferase
MSQSNLRRVAILGGARIPFARSNTAYAEASNQDMLTAALAAVVERHSLKGVRLGDVVAGAVINHVKDWNIAREATLSSGLAPETPGLTLQRACGTSLEAALIIASNIAIGRYDAGIAAGTDTTSDAPIVYRDGLRKALLRAMRAKSLGQRVSALASIKLKDIGPGTPGVIEPRTGLSMGQHCELMVKEWKISREAQDRLAYESHQKAAAAWEAGWYADHVIPFRGLTTDNNVRKDSTLEKMATLKPAFDRSAAGTLTAANSTPLTDGAAAVLLASEDWAKARRLPVMAYLSFGETAAVDYVGTGKEGLLMAPAYAVPRMLDRAGLTLQDFDFYEIHEAFAGQVLCTLAAWESAEFCKQKLGRDKALGSIDRAKLNVKGGSVAVGHPFAATGARVLTQAAKLIEQKGSGRALISVCTAGGMGVTAIVER